MRSILQKGGKKDGSAAVRCDSGMPRSSKNGSALREKDGGKPGGPTLGSRRQLCIPRCIRGRRCRLHRHCSCHSSPRHGLRRPGPPGVIFAYSPTKERLPVPRPRGNARDRLRAPVALGAGRGRGEAAWRARQPPRRSAPLRTRPAPRARRPGVHAGPPDRPAARHDPLGAAPAGSARWPRPPARGTRPVRMRSEKGRRAGAVGGRRGPLLRAAASAAAPAEPRRAPRPPQRPADPRNVLAVRLEPRSPLDLDERLAEAAKTRQGRATPAGDTARAGLGPRRLVERSQRFAAPAEFD